MCKIGFHNFSGVQSDFRSDICVELQKPIGTRDKCKSWITLKFSDDVAFRKNGTENAPCSPRLLFLLQGIRIRTIFDRFCDAARDNDKNKR